MLTYNLDHAVHCFASIRCLVRLTRIREGARAATANVLPFLHDTDPDVRFAATNCLNAIARPR